MTDPEQFDEFYVETRGRLLLQTFALTGDLTAARAAVKATFVMAWHHWRKVGRADDPELAVRPYAWRHALRRHTARLWQRDKKIDPEAKRVLDALASLSVVERRALLLTQLAGVPVPQMAREVGLPRERAERELSGAVADYAAALDVAAEDIPGTFSALVPIAAESRLPRATIIRRSGATRRRTHTLVGAAAGAVALAVCTAFVVDPTGARPTLDRGTAERGPSAAALENEESTPLTKQTLVGPSVVARATGTGGWVTKQTTDNSEGNGRVAPCQRDRYADPRGAAGLVRTMERRGKPDAKGTSTIQMSELSRSKRAARKAFTKALGWYAGCQVERAQLISTWRAAGVGDQAMLVVLRLWKAPVRTVVVGIARTGQFTTTTVSEARGEVRPAGVDRHARLLSKAVSRLCTLPEGGACADRTKLRIVAPLAIGTVPAMINQIDLPPVSGIDKAWYADKARRAHSNPAATRCDNTSFSGKYRGAKFRAGYTRTFLILRAKLPAQFGITETVAALPKKQARQLVEEVRNDLATCDEGDKGLGTDIEQIADHRKGQKSLTAWSVRIEVSDERTVRYDMAIIRRGSSVAQLGFVPAGDVDMRRHEFVALAFRAMERLIEMPKPGKLPNG